MDQSETMPQTDVMGSVLDTFVGYNLKRAYMIVDSDFRAVMADKALSPRVFSALTLIARVPNLTQSDLSRRLGIERSGLVAIVDHLEGNGYVRRVPVPRDRRVHALCATDKGIALHQEAVALVRAHEDRLLSTFSDSERQQLISLLQRIRNISEKDEA